MRNIPEQDAMTYSRPEKQVCETRREDHLVEQRGHQLLRCREMRSPAVTPLPSGKVVPHCLLSEGWWLTGQAEEFGRNTWKQVPWTMHLFPGVSAKYQAGNG